MSHKSQTQPWLSGGEAKRDYIRNLFAEVSPVYDFMNSAMSLGLHGRWRTFAVTKLNLRPGQTVLDLCSGTGDFGKPLRKVLGNSGRIIALDFCEPMLKRAQRKPYRLTVTLADACRIPLRENTADGVTVGWGLRNLSDLKQGLSEIHRVLKPGAKIVSVDMANPRSRFVGGAARFLFRILVPSMGAVIGKRDAYLYLQQSTEKYKTREELKQLMEETGFRNVRFHDLFFGLICVHEGEK
ncbi:MAG TPA: ubiquinone/menaquinone biosynthesis methyltransferase [Fimbriimonadales bacterium]|nr:ubiquinone/menaquinone biosynthesis methyltransferase [Fimbriimonadales bacterium]